MSHLGVDFFYELESCYINVTFVVDIIWIWKISDVEFIVEQMSNWWLYTYIVFLSGFLKYGCIHVLVPWPGFKCEVFDDLFLLVLTCSCPLSFLGISWDFNALGGGCDMPVCPNFSNSRIIDHSGIFLLRFGTSLIHYIK